jgi:two-component system, NtrC family, sensor kinase
LLNLINNAFYAVNAQKTSTVETTHALSLHRHRLTLQTHRYRSTKNLGDRIEISVKDNGPGIPDEIKNKIFQPFFTTKPTGEGTGLGLSLSYDIVKAHGGELKVETKEARPDGIIGRGEGSVFTLILPV